MTIIWQTSDEWYGRKHLARTEGKKAEIFEGLTEVPVYHIYNDEGGFLSGSGPNDISSVKETCENYLLNKKAA